MNMHATDIYLHKHTVLVPMHWSYFSLLH